jgi:hypothetical protein
MLTLEVQETTRTLTTTGGITTTIVQQIGNNGLSTGAIAGIIGGLGAGLLISVATIFFLLGRRKRKRDALMPLKEMPVYREEEPEKVEEQVQDGPMFIMEEEIGGRLQHPDEDTPHCARLGPPVKG